MEIDELEVRATAAMIYVHSMIEAGSNIQAIGYWDFMIAEPVESGNFKAHLRIEKLAHAFGPVEHIKRDIIEYLRHLNRVAFEFT